MNLSFWEKSAMQYPSDVTVIGAGIVGLSTAISIKEKYPKAEVIIFERGSSPQGASTKNAGFACFGSASELLDDINSMGIEKTMDIVAMRLEGLKMLKSRCGIKSINYMESGGSELFGREEHELKNLYLDNIESLNRMMYDMHGVENVFTIRKDMSPPHFDEMAVFNPYEGVLDPVKMMMVLHKRCLSLGVRIFYGVNIEKIHTSDSILTTSEGTEVHFRQLIVCTNGFSLKLFPDIPVVPARNQVLITKPLKTELPLCGFHMDRGYVYFRRVGDRILLGGGRHKDRDNEITSDVGLTPTIQNYLLTILEDIHPGATNDIDMWWSGILGTGPEKAPLIDTISPNITLGVRLGGMGVAIGSWMGDILADRVLA